MLKRLTVFGLVLLLLLMGIPVPAGAASLEVQFQIGKSVYWVDGRVEPMDVAPYIDENHRTLVPVRYLAYALGVPKENVFWISENSLIYLYKDTVGVALVLNEPGIWKIEGDDAEVLGQLLSLAQRIQKVVEPIEKEGREPTSQEIKELEALLREVCELMGVKPSFGSPEEVEETHRKWEEAFDAWLWEVWRHHSKVVIMDTVPVIKNGRTFLPARYVAEALGYKVDWDGNSQKVIISPQKGIYP